MSFRSMLYTIAKLLGDLAALFTGRVGRRAGRRVAGRVTGRLFGRLFK